LIIVKPETVIKWNRQGFKLYWRWKSQTNKVGRPRIPKEIRDLIRQMSWENPTWGTPRIQSELKLLGYELADSTVARYMVKHHKPPSQTWRTFLKNHVKQIAAIDFFTVPTVRFQILYCFIVLRHHRRRLVHFNVTANPTAQWTSQMDYYNNCRTHLSLKKNSPKPRNVEKPEKGKVVSIPKVGGLHHLYKRVA